MRQQCLMTSKLKKIAFSAVCKINQHNQWVVCEGKSCVKTCSRCYCGLPGGSSGDHFFIWYLDYHDFHAHHHHGNMIIIVFTIFMIFPAPLPANAEQHLCREQQHDYLPHSHRHHLATLHCQTNPEKGAFFRSARTSCTAFDWPVRGQEFSLSSSSLPQNYGLHGSQIGLTCQVHLV